ncbi:Probable RNA-directed DNA polymerase from transposon BS [Eumeta japonica]|uniref:Probable RNA-directed DNA polymerase from transposon BS n=1 Tax=Eumeta variegata TaxID=151549 RepID=A0A4C1VDQ9_EUMVA|nr:Probable RNA-directed DNA polymerase from transposon BS [Eumeta japonica]
MASSLLQTQSSPHCYLQIIDHSCPNIYGKLMLKLAWSHSMWIFVQPQMLVAVEAISYPSDTKPGILGYKSQYRLLILGQDETGTFVGGSLDSIFAQPQMDPYECAGVRRSFFVNFLVTEAFLVEADVDAQATSFASADAKINGDGGFLAAEALAASSSSVLTPLVAFESCMYLKNDDFKNENSSEQCSKSEDLDRIKSIPELPDAEPNTSVYPDPEQPQQASKALQSKATDLSNALKRLKICLEELERYRHEFVNLKMEANSVAEKWSITPEFSKTRQRKVKRHFDELCEDERLQDPEGFLTMLFLHRKASKWKMNMKSPIRIERRPMPSSGTYMYRLYNVTGLTDRAPSKEFATGPRRYSYATGQHACVSIDFARYRSSDSVLDDRRARESSFAPLQPCGGRRTLSLQQEYNVLQETEATFGGSKSATSSRESSPSPSVCSRKRSSSAFSSEDASDQSDGIVKGSDREVEDRLFTQTCRKPRKLVRRQQTNSIDSVTMELDINTGMSTVGNNTSASASLSGRKATVTAKTVKSRKLNSFLINNSFPFYTFALDEERKVKVVIKGVPIEIKTNEVKADLEYQGYSVLAVHRMHRRDGTALAEECRQYHRFQLLQLSTYEHAALNCHAQSRSVKCPVPHWTKECNRTKDAARDTTRWECPQPTSVPRSAGTVASALGEDISTIMSILQVVRSAEVSEIAAKFRKHGVDRLKIILDNQDLSYSSVELEKYALEYKTDIIMAQETHLKPHFSNSCKISNFILLRTDRQGAPKDGTAIYYNGALYCCLIDTPPLINIEATACRFSMIGHGILILVSVYLPPKKVLLRSDLEALFALRDAVILFGDFNGKSTNWKCNYSNRNGREIEALAKSLHFNIVTPLTPTYDPNNNNHRPDILDIALMKGVALKLSCIEPLQWLNSDHRPALMMSSSRTVPAKSDRRELPGDVIELIRDKNAAFRRAGKYPTCESRSRAAVLTPTLKLPDDSIAFDDREKAECLSDSIEHQCSDNPPYDFENVWWVEEEVFHRVSLPPRDDLDSITHDKVSKHIKGLKIKKAPGGDTISSKALKCFSAPLVALLVVIFNACIQNCYFPTVTKEPVVISIPKPGKPRDLSASYRSISILNVLGKLFEKTLKTRLSDHLIGKGFIINEQYGFRTNNFCLQQALRLIEYIPEGFKVKRKTVAVFFDVAKAFVRVWARLDNTYSSMRPIRAGVLQGSTLFPLLYSAYVNDIPRLSIGVQLALFADDTALYLRSNSIGNILPRLQRAIDELT